MKHLYIYSTSLILLILTFTNSLAFESGSNGSDGVLNVTVDTVLQLPASGVFNFTDVTVAEGATLRFRKNSSNTPVYLLASGNITIEGTIQVNGETSVNTDDDDRVGDGQPGSGGAGGFDGGRGGYIGIDADNDGAPGQGPGGGNPGTLAKSCAFEFSGTGGGGGGYFAAGLKGDSGGAGGQAYGVSYLIPLIGGSGGGGASGPGNSGRSNTFGSGGGGGGGAMLIASSGLISITGTITANGGGSGSVVKPSGGSCATGGSGGGGSGGAIRIIASKLTGTGTLRAIGGVAARDAREKGGRGSHGRIRLEADEFQWWVATTPSFSSSAPNPVFVADLPGIVISSVGGINAPGSPTGFNDIILPDNTPNPVTVEFTTTDIPTGGVIELTATPVTGSSVTVNSSAIGGSEASGSASALIDLPNGPSTLIATTTFLVIADLGKDYSKYVMGEEVKEVKIASVAGQGSVTTFITTQGNEYPWHTGQLSNN